MNLTIKTDSLRSNSQTVPNSTPADVISYTVADSELGKVLVARSAKGVCAILLGDDAGELEADLVNRFPQAVLIKSEATVKADVAKVLRYIAKPSDGARYAWNAISTPRLGKAEGDLGRPDGELYGTGQMDQSPGQSTRGCQRLRGKSDRVSYPMSSCCP